MATELSAREREIILEAAAGFTDKEIAKRLDLSVASVRTYWERLRKKLDASNKSHAIAKALRGIVMEQEKQEFERTDMIRLIVENSVDYAIFALDVEGNITTWNVGVERTLGFAEEEFLKMRTEDIFTPEDRKKGEPEKEMRTAITEGRAEDERWHMCKDGSRFYGSGVMVSLRDAEGNLRGCGKVVRDYTNMHLLVERLQQQAG